jgi:hypothetical protein
MDCVAAAVMYTSAPLISLSWTDATCALSRLWNGGCYWRNSSKPRSGLVLNAQFEQDGRLVFEHACLLGCEGIVSKRKDSRYRSGRSRHWVKCKNPAAPAVKREAEEDWAAKRNGDER